MPKMCSACEQGHHDDCGMQTWCTCPCPGPPEYHTDLGTCCICSAPHAGVLLMLQARAPVRGTGWGCFTCGLAQDGAIAVICEDCESMYHTQGAVETALRFVCLGYPGDRKRLPIEHLRGEHVHVRRRHPEMPQMPALTVLESDTRWGEHVEEGQGCLCSRCGTTIWEGTVALRAWPEDGDWELRYHPVCFGAEPRVEDPYDEENLC